MTYLITGGSGFIGSNLCVALHAAGERFRILDKRPSQMFLDFATEIDILDQSRLTQSLIGDAIIHLAAEHRDDVQPISAYEQVNVEGTRNLCRAASLRGINRIVFTSSVAVYGFAPPGTDEDGAINPFNEYGRTKYAAENVLRDWAGEDPARSLTIIRPTVVFGPGNRGNVFNLFRQIASGRFLMVGDGTNCKSMAYVENLVAFIRYTARLGPGVHLYNYVDQPDLTMNDLVARVRQTVLSKTGTGMRLPLGIGLGLGHLADGIASLTGKSLPVSALRVRKFTTTTSFSSRVNTVPGFVARVPLTEGIDRTLAAEFISPDPARPVFYTE